MRGFFFRFLIFVFGGLFYGLTEIVYRGHTHFTMVITGGICAVFLWQISRTAYPMWQKCFLGGAVITTAEFLSGAVFNIALGWNIWDYSGRAYDLFGQICPLFSAFWTGLSAVAMTVFKKLSLLEETE